MPRASKIPILPKTKAMMWGKRFQEIQRHIVVDSQGLPQAVVVTTANVMHREGTLCTHRASGQS